MSKRNYTPSVNAEPGGDKANDYASLSDGEAPPRTAVLQPRCGL
jgi:hypothetical protein